MKQVQFTVKQAITILILTTVGVTFYFSTTKTPIEQLREDMISVYIDGDSSVKSTSLTIAKIVLNAKDGEACASLFTNVILPLDKDLTDGTIRTKQNVLKAIDLMIAAIEKKCKRN